MINRLFHAGGSCLGENEKNKIKCITRVQYCQFVTKLICSIGA